MGRAVFLEGNREAGDRGGGIACRSVQRGHSTAPVKNDGA
jgi:hypothetical protein